ncbi:type III-A CRISPR-associated RAMP protein Csm4 [Parafilimonas sp.]|uniref:type III-A CRISPR-associated RAMP protein Csm4 n=1 Tax=Parafilimonas sp. TaxID=1969739 RepID=UPI0039E357D6
MPELDIIQLNFTTPLHIGNERADYASGHAILHSDAFTAAIFFAWDRLGFPEWIPTAENPDTGFAISSLFPYTTVSGQPVYFLPKPLILIRSLNVLDDTSLRKKLKKVAWIDRELFTAYTQRKLLSVPVEENIVGNFQASIALKPQGAFMESNVVPRAAVSRTGEEDTAIFYIERFYFKPHSGLYCLASFANNEIRKRFQAAIRFLGDEGIGTDRNIGNGKFEPKFGDVWPLPETGSFSYGINLGLFCPESSEQLTGMIAGEDAGYDFIKRGGWLSEPYNTWRKKNVYMFKEGSCFKMENCATFNGLPVGGKMWDVRPTETIPVITHPVWRNGRTIFIPVK